MKRVEKKLKKGYHLKRRKEVITYGINTPEGDI